MKTLKIMSVIGIVIFAGHLLLVNLPSSVAVQGPESSADLIQSIYALALSIVGFIASIKIS